MFFHLLCSLGIRGKEQNWCKDPSLCWFKGKFSASVGRKEGGAFPGGGHVSGEGVVVCLQKQWP